MNYMRPDRDAAAHRFRQSARHADSAITFIREAWLNDGAEGEAAHLLIAEIERLRFELKAAQNAIEIGDGEIERLRAELRQIRDSKQTAGRRLADGSYHPVGCVCTDCV